SRRRLRRTTPPPVQRRSPCRLHRRPQSLQVPHGRTRVSEKAGQLGYSKAQTCVRHMPALPHLAPSTDILLQLLGRSESSWKNGPIRGDSDLFDRALAPVAELSY